jgi:hypothetical protein
MASSRDVRDILGLSPLAPADMIAIGMKDKKPRHKSAKGIMDKDGNAAGAGQGQGQGQGAGSKAKRPEGMARELYNLLYNDSKDAPPIVQTDTTLANGEHEGTLALGARSVPGPGRFISSY